MFWDNYLYHCNRLGLSPNAVASAVGVNSSGSVTGWKNGAIPRSATLYRLADLFDCTADSLLDDAPPKEAPAAQGDGLSDNEKEVIRLFRSASPETRAAMLHLLRVAEAAQSVQDADVVGR